MLFPGIIENRLGRPVLDHIASPAAGGSINVQKCGRVRDAFGLLQIVGDDCDGVLLFQLGHQLFDPARRYRIERRARLVHQQHRRLGGDGARDAQPLLLSAGERKRAGSKFVLDFVP
jgi:hypothetical protein